MIYSEWKTSVLSFLGVDANRRGIESLRDGFIKAAAADLKHFVPCFKDNKIGYADGDVVPFVADDRSAEAAGMFVKNKLARLSEKDLALAASYERDYVTLRRLLVRTCSDSDDQHDFTVVFGDVLPFTEVIYKDELGNLLTSLTGYKVIFTIKGPYPFVPVTIDSTAGITLTGMTATWLLDTSVQDANLIDLYTRGSTYGYTVKLQKTTPLRTVTVREGTITLK